MNTKAKLTVTLCTAILSSVCLAAPGDRTELGSIGIIGPGQHGHDKDIGLSKLSKDKFYTIEATLHNTNMQDVDYKITTSYATSANGTLGNIVTDKGEVLAIDEDGYRGHLASTDKDVKITIKNVKPNYGIIKEDYFKVFNLTSNPTDHPGASLEVRGIVAIEQADSGEGPAAPSASGSQPPSH